MRRFYIKQSVINHDPKEVMSTCVFLAGKVENSTMDLSVLEGGIKGLDKMRVKELEFTIAEALRFEFWVRHPFEASFGIFLDCQVIE
jgi:cyclin H